MKRLVGLIIFFIVLVAVSLSAGQVAAQSLASPSGLRQNNQVRRQELRENMCERVKARIEERRENFQDRRDRHAAIYQGIVNRLNNLVSKLKARGCDASQVETDLSAFDKLINELVTAFNLFLDKVHAVGVPVCQEQPGDWRTALTAAKDQLRAVQAKQREIRTFYKNTLKPDVKTAGQTCRAQTRPSPTPTASPAGETE